MQLLSGHKNYLIKLYLKNFFIVTLIFASLIFVLNVLEEVSFFNNLNFCVLPNPVRALGPEFYRA